LRNAGIVVIVVATEPKVSGFKPGWGRWISKIRSTPSFGGEVKPSAPCSKILGHVKESFEVWKGYFIRLNSLCP
jgi:hypothetical protein